MLCRDCRTYFVDHLLASHCPPLMATLLSMYHGFFLSLLDSPSHEVQVIARLAARDLRSHLGSNLRLLRDRTGCDPWTASRDEKKMRLRDSYCSHIPDEVTWRILLMDKLLQSRQTAYYGMNEDDKNHLTELINSLARN